MDILSLISFEGSYGCEKWLSFSVGATSEAEGDWWAEAVYIDPERSLTISSRAVTGGRTLQCSVVASYLEATYFFRDPIQIPFVITFMLEEDKVKAKLVT